ncbi:MAG: hypothetical protein JST55_11320 [Bacteroidetes bacterium]|nr:hypothetical protein [Bacteroidota bacterium]
MKKITPIILLTALLFNVSGFLIACHYFPVDETSEFTKIFKTENSLENIIIEINESEDNSNNDYSDVQFQNFLFHSNKRQNLIKQTICLASIIDIPPVLQSQCISPDGVPPKSII